MEFNENTQFPIFTKKNSTYFYYLSKGMFFCFNTYNASVYLESVTILSTEEVITKEAFIEANKDLLQKTGLINLFEVSEKTDWQRAAEKYCLHLEEKTKEAEKYYQENKQLSQRLKIAIEDDKEQVNQIKTFESVIEKQQEKIEGYKKMQENFRLEIQNLKKFNQNLEKAFDEEVKGLDLKIKSLESTLKHYL